MASYVSTFTGNGSEVHFTAGFPVLRLSDLAVVVNGTWLTLGVDYSVSGSTSGPLATLTTAPANGAVVTLRSAVGYTPTDPASPASVVPTLHATDEALFRWAADEIAKARGANPYESTSDASTVLATGSSTARTLASRFSDLVNVLDHGADPTGVADSTEAFQDALDVGHGVFVPAGAYTLSSPLSLPGGAYLVGAGKDLTVITNSTTDMFVWSGIIYHARFSDMRLISGVGGGHIWNGGSSSMVTSVFRDLWAEQSNAGKSIWLSNGSASPAAVPNIIGNVWDSCRFTAARAATVSPFRLINGDGAYNSNTWRNLWLDGCESVPFFEIINSEGGAAHQNYASDLVFRDIIGELCEGGILHAQTVTNLVVDNVVDWDSATFRASVFKVSGYRSEWKSRNVKISNSGIRNGAIGAHYIVEVEAATPGVVISGVFNATSNPELSVDMTGTHPVTITAIPGQPQTIPSVAGGYQDVFWSGGDGYLLPNGGNLAVLSVNANTAVTMRMFGTFLRGQGITVLYKNLNGSATPSITWASDFKLASAFASVAASKQRSISFVYDGAHFIEVGRGTEIDV